MLICTQQIGKHRKKFNVHNQHFKVVSKYSKVVLACEQGRIQTRLSKHCNPLSFIRHYWLLCCSMLFFKALPRGFSCCYLVAGEKLRSSDISDISPQVHLYKPAHHGHGRQCTSSFSEADSSLWIERIGSASLVWYLPSPSQISSTLPLKDWKINSREMCSAGWLSFSR